MRLIDEDLFLENVRKELNCDERCCECVHDNLCEIYKTTLKQHTAYDVDKVIERLDGIMEDESMRFCEQAVNAAKEIVKSGFCKEVGNE